MNFSALSFFHPLCGLISKSTHKTKLPSLLILSIIWLLGAVCDRLWFALDHSVPGWDQADYLTGTLNYWRALQNPQWWDDKWWQSFWLLSSKIPPLTYIVTGILQHIVGTGSDQATLILLGFSAILLASVYGLGTILLGESIGLWAAALCQVMPALYRFRLEFLLDYPLAAVVTLSFFCLTAWHLTSRKPQRQNLSVQLFWATAFGFSLGLALLVKQTTLLFLFTPVLWVGIGALRRKNWGRLTQLVGSLCLSVLVFGPWYRTNWLLILTSGKRATIDSAIAEGEAPLNTLPAWTFYWQQIPHQVSLPLLLVPIFGLLLYWGRSKFKPPYSPFKWLAIFLVGAYFFSSLNVNKDERYVLPYLPVLSIFLAYGLTRLSSLWGKRIRWGTFGLAVLLMLCNLFPVGGSVGNLLTQVFSPKVQHFPQIQQELPHQQVIDQIIQTEPYLCTTLGVLPSTGTINQHNLNYYGALKNFQVYGRQVGTRKKYVEQDGRSLSWFLTKTGDQGSVPEAQAAMVQFVEQSGGFQLNKSWNLSDGSVLKLYHQPTPPIEVKPVSSEALKTPKITLSRVSVPATTPPGVPVPVTYEWFGSWTELQQGLVLLTWRNGDQNWIHDHGIGMGALHPAAQQREGTFQVIERMAMLPPKEITSGTYSLEAIYLNRISGESYPLALSKVTIQIDPQATATPAPELDLVTQLRTLAASLPQGVTALEQVFEQVGRINQYDPVQDYLVQARLTLEYRLQQFPPNRDWAYALGLTNVLQRRVDGAIAAFEQVTKLDAENPFAHAYLAFVHLYNWQPQAAQKSLQPSLAKNPNLKEFRILAGIAALMQGNLFQAWQELSALN